MSDWSESLLGQASALQMCLIICSEISMLSKHILIKNHSVHHQFIHDETGKLPNQENSHLTQGGVHGFRLHRGPSLRTPLPAAPQSLTSPRTSHIQSPPCTSRAPTTPDPRDPQSKHGPYGPLALGPFGFSPPVSTNPCCGGTPLAGSIQW